MGRKSGIVHTTLLILMGAAVAALLAWTLWSGLDYYRTPLNDRPHHEDFRAYRPAGRIGHGLGILAHDYVDISRHIAFLFDTVSSV